MKILKLLFPALGVGLLISLFASCSEENDEWDPYYDWQTRNAAWFQAVTDSATVAMAQAKAQWGSAWENHCDWRQYKTLYQPQDYNTGQATDSICVRIVTRGTGSYSPTWSDSVRISFRGWLMPTTYRIYNDDNLMVDSLMQEVFTQTYIGPFDAQTAAPQLSGVNPFVQGFSTALQYMVEGDDWYVYVPSTLAYGETANGSIPANSTLVWRIHLTGVYPANSVVPDWK